MGYISSKNKENKIKISSNIRNDVGELIKLLKSNDRKSWKYAESKLIMVGVNAIKDLIQIFYDPNSPTHVRRRSSKILEKIGDPAVDPLLIALKDPNKKVRESSAYTLGLIKDNRSIGPLIEALKDDYDYLQYRAEDSLKKLVVPHFFNFLRQSK